MPEMIRRSEDYLYKDACNSSVCAQDIKSVGVFSYILLLFLFMIPILGGIAAIIIAISSKNASIKNFAKAFILYSLLTIVVMLLIGVLIFFKGKDLISGFTSGQSTLNVNDIIPGLGVKDLKLTGDGSDMSNKILELIMRYI